MTVRHHAAVWVVAAALVVPALIRAQDSSVQAARTLYASAAYEEALWILDGMQHATLQDGERAEIARYRALCLFALGRGSEAEATIEAMVADQPLRRTAAEDDIPPRMRAAVSAARQRILPGVIQGVYAEAKGAFDAKQFETARLKFGKVLETLGDPDVASLAGQPPLADIKTLARGFLELSVAAIPPPPPPEPEAPEPPQPDLTVYTTDDLDVTPPQIVSQELPAYPGVLRSPRVGVIEVLINASGAVEGATMRIPVDQVYDRRAIAAAKEWSYRPATRNGTPVRFLKRIRINLAAS